jgi:hypothetical protein
LSVRERERERERERDTEHVKIFSKTTNINTSHANVYVQALEVP